MVSDLGRVKSRARTLPNGAQAGEVMLTPQRDDDGYLWVWLRGERVPLSHVVLEAFTGVRPYGTEACHDPDLSRGRDDCRAVVLRWGTHRENERDKRRTGVDQKQQVAPPVTAVASVACEVQE